MNKLHHSSPPKLDVELPTAPESQSGFTQKHCGCGYGKRVSFVVVLFLAVIATLGVLGAQAFLTKKDNSQLAPVGSTPVSNAEFRNEIEALVAQVSNPVTLLDPLSPQSRAVEWLTLSDSMLTSVEDPNFLQRYALMVFFFSTNGPFWALPETWDELSGLHECNFTGITCDPAGQVLNMNLFSTRLSGSLPEELGLLENLQQLVLGKNELKGSIPESIFTDTTNLRVLDLSSNDISSTISSEIGNLKELRRLFLSTTKLSGPLPESLKHLSNLKAVQFFLANLEGPIFDFILTWPNLEKLNLGQSLFTGVLPTEIGLMSNLDSFICDGLNVTLTLPTEIGLLTSLELIRIHSNGNHEGSIPSEVGNLSALSYFQVEGNFFMGTIPSEIGNLSRLRFLQISGGSINGTIPSQLGKLLSLEHLSLSGNTLSGMIPTQLGNLSNMNIFYTLDNDLEGRMPAELCAVEEVGYDCSVQCDCCILACGDRA